MADTATPPQVGSGNPQDGTRETTKNPEAVQETDTATDDGLITQRLERANREAAAYRTKALAFESQLKELQEQVETASSSTHTETERLKIALAKAQQQAKDAVTRAEETERLRMAQASAIRYKLPEEFIPALSGKTQDEIDDAAKLLQKVLLAEAKKLAQTLPPDPEGGPKGTVTRDANGKFSEADLVKARQSHGNVF